MFLFRKNKRTRAAYTRMPIPSWLKTACGRLQDRMIARLSYYEGRLNTRQKKIAILGFCTTMVCFFAFPLITAIRSNPKDKALLFKHEAITRPKDSRLDDTLDLELLRRLKKTQNVIKRDSITP
jgi:hypothetical protein